LCLCLACIGVCWFFIFIFDLKIFFLTNLMFGLIRAFRSLSLFLFSNLLYIQYISMSIHRGSPMNFQSMLILSFVFSLYIFLGKIIFLNNLRTIRRSFWLNIVVCLIIPFFWLDFFLMVLKMWYIIRFTKNLL
jgi:hypothetical protein